jgi:hypothetical protein
MFCCGARFRLWNRAARFIINVPGREYSFVASVAVAGRAKLNGDENRAALREQP